MSSARRPDHAIRDEILADTPLGSTEAEVERYAKLRFVQDNFFGWGNSLDEGKGRILTCLYGDYVEVSNFPFATCVRVSWQFSKEGRLIRVNVGRWVDSF
jgi:hypothetical protein